jgi:hypothetical protein
MHLSGEAWKSHAIAMCDVCTDFGRSTEAALLASAIEEATKWIRQQKNTSQNGGKVSVTSLLASLMTSALVALVFLLFLAAIELLQYRECREDLTSCRLGDPKADGEA